MLLFIASLLALAPSQYPEATRGSIVETLHGVEVADPYRWLEQDVRENDDVRQWVTAQNEVTRAYLDNIPALPKIKDKLTKTWNYERQGLPFHRGSRWFQSRNSGLQNHSVIFTGQSPTDINTVLLDPNTFSGDGTKALSIYSPSPEGTYLVWGVSNAGSDWSTWYAKDLESGKLFPDVMTGIKNDSPSWVPDESGFYYSRYPHSNSEGHIETTDASELWFHRIGTVQEDDILVWSDAKHPDRFYGVSVTKDGGWLVVSVNEGTSSNNALLVKGPDEDKLHWLVTDFDAEVSLIGGIQNTLWFKTDRDAPNGKIISVDLNSTTPKWSTVIPEQKNSLRGADIVGGKITCSWLEDASSKVTVHTLQGALLYEVALPAIGTASGFGGTNQDETVYWSFSSYNQPPSIYSLVLNTQETTLFWKSEVPIDLSDIVVQREFVRSTDGALVPIFIVASSDTQLDGKNPTLLYGYGGFDIAILPHFSPSRATWIEMGGVYVVACIRGGSEYGRNWHEGGMLLNKQQCFDDFIACSQWLIDNSWTSSETLAIQGGSNGGLLVGACMTQRPDLFGACLPAVGVLDMLRFHLFTVGWAWVSDYGDPKEKEMFNYLLGYSPYHNLKVGTCYPPTMVTTGDTDDRVVPGHSFKFAAGLQYSQSCANPVLIRIETRAGHGAGKPTHLRIEEAADVYAFLWQTLGMNN
ncbi:MAG: S9 family peptidase [Planctomycetes bacterium]|nr:S9 family peptidase [Planctomycetota bacterium]